MSIGELQLIVNDFLSQIEGQFLRIIIISNFDKIRILDNELIQLINYCWFLLVCTQFKKYCEKSGQTRSF